VNGDTLPKAPALTERIPLTVSVVIPARNAAWCLTEQLRALAAQDFDGTWEVVVSDNGSTDGTVALVRDLAASFPVPLRVVDASRRPGPAHARNEGALPHLARCSPSAMQTMSSLLDGSPGRSRR
jgi:cellulose synthase/poly-beta-1,6-N-acetylglucosamine synthase-like glycosyltransferase